MNHNSAVPISVYILDFATLEVYEKFRPNVVT